MREPASILNDVLGPVMRGPSSSHTAGSYRLARLAADLLGARPAEARIIFDRAGSYARVYHEQGADRAFAAGLLGWELTDARFLDALSLTPASGLRLSFEISVMEGAGHPNDVAIELADGRGSRLVVRGTSIGGGAVEVVRVDGWELRLTGQQYVVLVETSGDVPDRVRVALAGDGALAGAPETLARPERKLIVARRYSPLSETESRSLRSTPGVIRVREARPIALVKRAGPLAESGEEMVRLARSRGWSLGQVARASEAVVLAMDEAAVDRELLHRFDVMRQSVEAGLSEPPPPMQLLEPCAAAIIRADSQGRLAQGGLHARAAARAMAVMHTNSAMGVVCAAPTGGAAGVLPGVLVTLAEERGVGRELVARALWAASAVGVVIATRATFAAEVAGCQVEIGAAGAMAAAAVVEAAAGTAQQAADAAAIALQNTMGSVCDLVKGMVEIPCHTRNAVAASNAFVCADLVLGGYRNPIPLDETVDAVYAVGRMLPSELRCTARGGLAITPSAMSLNRRPAR